MANKNKNANNAAAGNREGTEDQTDVAENTGGDKTSEDAAAGAGIKVKSEEIQRKSDSLPPLKEGNGVLIAVSSKERKGKTIVAVSGQPIIFDEKGIAEVNEADALYLKQIPGFEFS